MVSAVNGFNEALFVELKLRFRRLKVNCTASDARGTKGLIKVVKRLNIFKASAAADEIVTFSLQCRPHGGVGKPCVRVNECRIKLISRHQAVRTHHHVADQNRAVYAGI